jgi:adenine-specific DNA-methyltransferase
MNWRVDKVPRRQCYDLSMPSLNFKGKALVQNFHLLVPYHELKLVKSKSLSPKVSLHDNLVVHGDNLKALKSLLPYYHGKVKCIYIDPPYNTGNEKWVYNDNVSSPMIQEWLGKVVDREDLTRHDKWLCMMMPRLKLLREFLTDDGVIFVSIDDNEVHWLRGMLDEVFGEVNFVATVLWQKKYASSSDHGGIAPMHDYILVYRKSDRFKRNLLERTLVSDEQYKFEDERGIFRVSDYTCNKTAEERPNLYYAITNPNTGKQTWPKKTRVWAYSRTEHERHVEEDLIWWGKDGQGAVPGFKRYRHLLKGDGGLVPSTWWDFEFAGHTDDAKKEFREIFPSSGSDDFVTIKPTSLIERILEIGTDKDSIVLDAFAGTGTTAHSVLALNKQDDGSRRFLMIESEGYTGTLTAERIRRVIKGVPKSKDEALQKGLGGSFSYVEVGHPMQLEALLKAEKLPSYENLASYVFYTATGEDFDAKRINRKTGFIGESAQYDVYLLYEPDLDYLKSTALTLDIARSLPKGSGKKRLVFAPTKYLDSIHLEENRIEFCQLPFEIYKAVKRNP